MPVMWRDLSAWLSAVENIHMKHVICPVLVTTSPVMRALQRLMSFSDGTMCYLLLTTVGLLFTFWCPSIYLSLLFTVSLFLFLHLSFSLFLNVCELTIMLWVQRLGFSGLSRYVKLPHPNNSGTYIHLFWPNLTSSSTNIQEKAKNQN